nr:hypothetical protein CFP56_42515 [Quercus suber]
MGILLCLAFVPRKRHRYPPEIEVHSTEVDGRQEYSVPLSIHVGGAHEDSSVQNNRRSKQEMPKNREAENSKKNIERRRKGKEEEAEVGGKTAIEKMEVVGDMEMTGDVVVSGCDDKN